MSSTDNFEELDNKALRAKCEQYGLPNVPITDTSRKILIKRLRAAIDGTTAAPKSATKNRRETIHVTKIPTPVEAAAVVSEKTEQKRAVGRSANRRTTIAATSTTITEEVAPPAVAAKAASATQKRRSSRATPIEPEPPVQPVFTKRSAAILEEDDDDDDDLILVEAVERSERPTAVRNRSSRSLSLTKTPIVSTSYNKETLPATVHETESETESEVRDAFNYSTTTSTYTQRARISADPEVRVRQPIVPITRTSVEPKNFDFAKPTRAAAAVETEFVKPYASRYSSIGGAGGSYSTNTSASRRYTTGGPSSQYSTYVEDSSDVNEDEDDQGGEPIHTPYYSDFARRLERLKKDQLSGSIRDTSAKRDISATYTSAVVSGRKTDKQEQTAGDAFRNFLIALDRKYKIKQKLMIALSIFLLLTIYVFIFH